MASTVRRCQTGWLKQEGAEEPQYPSAARTPRCHKRQHHCRLQSGCRLYGGLEPKNEPDAQEEKEENSDAEYTKMEIPLPGHCIRV